MGNHLPVFVLFPYTFTVTPAKFIRLLVIVVVVPLLAGIYTYFKLSSLLLEPADQTATAPVSVVIAPGRTLGDIASELASLGVVKSAWGFKALARIKGQDSGIKAGEYEVSAAMTPRELLNKLIAGDVLKRKVLIPEGATIRDIVQAIADSGLATSQEVLAEVSPTSTWVKKLGLVQSSLEGYLFPNTYHFSRPTSAYEIIGAMILEGEKVWKNEFEARANALGRSKHWVLTLASIIEKEAGTVQEQPIIASVLYNRLQAYMPLQVDASVIYGIKNFNGDITKADLERDGPYNTYKHVGLPPTPIANPGAAAIRAALNPANTEFLYFVADGSGGHSFSKTLKEHEEKVDKFIRKKK